jgi:23S rRNA (cytosine1962-C5)-methyltransferase
MSSKPITVRLKPKVDARALRHGFPWVYADNLVLDRRTRALPPGAIAILEDAHRDPLAQVAFNPNSKIAARVLTRSLDEQIGPLWIAERVKRALAHRETLYGRPFYRLIHGESDGLPGVIADRFGDTVVFQPNAAWAEIMLPDFVSALSGVDGIRHILKSASGRARKLEGLDDKDAVLLGNPPPRAEVVMNGANYIADLASGQKTGLFFDQRPNHAFTAKLADGARVLDVFSHVGGFSLAALAGGAKSALAVDASEAALSLARDGAAASGYQDRFETRRGDAFAVLEALGQEKAQFDLVVCDPPAFAPAKSALQAGLRAYERVARLAAPLVAHDGALMLCSCSHAADLAKFRNACVHGIGRAGRDSQIIWSGGAGPDHPLHPQLGESGYLKALGFRMLS